MVNNKLSSILTMLMNECNIEDRALSRKIGIPATSISRLKNDQTANPTISTLQPLAKYFNITINQLIGDEPLPANRIEGLHTDVKITNSRVPVLNWNWVLEWLVGNRDSFKTQINEWLSTEKDLGDNAFALKIKNDLYGLYIRKDSTIIIEPEKDPLNGDLIIMTDNTNELFIKQVIKDNQEIYLKSINPEIKNTVKLGNEIILGIIIETRYEIQEQMLRKPSKENSLVTQLSKILAKKLNPT